MVQCTYPRVPEPTGKFWSPRLFHTVIVAEDGSWVIDPTAQNINPIHPCVRLMALTDLQAEWLYYWKWDF